MDAADEAAFLAIAQARAKPLRSSAFGLTGDWHAAEDLVQATLVKLYLAWPLRDAGAVNGWLLRTLTRLFIDETRRPWWRRELSVDAPPDQVASEVSSDRVDADVVTHLRALPPGQRACLVLRFLDDYSVEQTAEILRCSPGTVKSQTARGLAAIRTLMLPLERTQP